MSKLTIGKIRGLQQISTATSHITVLALDQRGSITQNLGIAKDAPDLYETLRDFKLDTIRCLAGLASAVLLDPEYVAAEAIALGVMPGSKGLIVTLEETGYVSQPSAPLNRIQPGWSLAKAKKMGASAVKLLVYYHPHSGELAETQERFVERLVAEARAEDLALLVEPMSYSTDPAVAKESPEFAAQRPEIVIETARRLGALGVEMLKLEFPYDASFNKDESAWEDACRAMTDASPVPWALLSAGVDFDIFKRQVLAACRAGASGFVAGRAIWKEATTLKGEQRSSFLAGTAVRRLAELVELAEKSARAWTACYPGLDTSAGKGWFRTYPDAE